MKQLKKRHEKADRSWIRGALTVEGSFLVPWTVLLTALLLVILFYVHNRTWYEAAGLEAALAGNQYIAGSSGTGRAGLTENDADTNTAGAGKAEQTARSRVQDQAMPGTDPEIQVNCTNGQTEVAFSGQSYPLFSDRFSLEVRKSAKKVRPVPVVRGAWLLKELAEGWKETDP